MGSLRREAKRRWLRQQKQLAKSVKQAPLEYAIAWKRKPDVYEAGAVGPPC